MIVDIIDVLKAFLGGYYSDSHRIECLTIARRSLIALYRFFGLLWLIWSQSKKPIFKDEVQSGWTSLLEMKSLSPIQSAPEGEAAGLSRRMHFYKRIIALFNSSVYQ
jgi:hypothetical protein